MVVPRILALMAILLPAPRDPPRLRIEPPGRVDLGSLGPREPGSRTYAFRNRSPDPISLRVLELSPGVKVSGPALGGAIPPGGVADLTLELDPRGWQGEQMRNVALETDDPRQGIYFLPVKAFIRPDLTVDATRLDFGTVEAHESPGLAFHFHRETGEPLALRITGPLPPHLEGEVLPGEGGARVLFTLRPGRIRPGSRMGMETVHIETSAPLQPSFDLYLGWRLRRAVEAEPARVVFQDPGLASMELTLASGDGRPFRILRARVQDGGFRVEGLRPGASPRHRLRIRRTCRRPFRTRLVLTFPGEGTELVVPLAYLPSTPGGPP